ncbi:MAG TPA: hypothetical protein VFK57_20650 [Vicinamibacterales bacterium]|nr:hypothetical protein [Vicinamibacterales bacterium]
MRSRLLLVVLPLAICARTAGAEDVKSANVTINVNLAARTSLKVSSRILQFDVTEAGATATASLEFTAGARMPAGSDVVLSVEPVRPLEGPGGAADVASDLSFSGEGQGMLAGSIDAAQSTVVGRWQGSGLRAGRVIFRLRAGAAGIYALPVRMVLSTP